MRVALALLLLGACGGGEIELSLRVPAPHDDDVSEIRVRSLEPPVAAPFHCDDIAFGRVDLNVIPVSVEGELILRSIDQAPLGSLAREQAHVFLAEAFDEEGTLLFSGCTEADALDEQTELTIELEPTVYLTLTDDPIITGPLGAPLAPLSLRIIDSFDEPAPGIDAEWVTAGAGGEAIAGAGTTDRDGVLAIAPGPLDRAGPFVIDMRFRWADFNPQRAYGFLMPQPIEEQLTGVLDAAADESLALLLDEGGDTVIRFCSGAALSCAGGDAIPVPAAAPGLLLALGGGRVLVLTESGWYTATAEDAVAVAAPTPAPIPDLPDGVALAGPCPIGDRVLFDYGFDVGTRYRIYGLDGVAIDADLPDAETELLAAGCAETVDEGEVRALVFRSELDQTFLLAEHEGDFLDTEWLVVGDAITVGVRGSGPLLGTQLELDDVVISRMLLGIEDDELYLEPIDADRPPGFPIRTAAGDVDGDGGLDVVSILEVGVDEDRFALWIALAAESSGARIQGSIALDALELCSEDGPDLFLLDGGDGTDEIVMLDWCGPMLRKIVVPMR